VRPIKLTKRVGTIRQVIRLSVVRRVEGNADANIKWGLSQVKLIKRTLRDPLEKQSTHL